MQQIHAVSFDLWGTLYEGGMQSENPIHPQRIRVLTTFLRKYGVVPEDDEVANACRWANEKFFFKWLKMHQTFTNYERLSLVLSRFGVSLDGKRAFALVQKYENVGSETWPTPKLGAKELVDLVASAVPTVVISDTAIMSGRMLRKVLRRDHLLDLFTGTFFSDEVGHPKPTSAMFDAAARRLCVEPDKLLHIGDRVATDGIGATRFGAKFAYVGNRDPRSEVDEVSIYTCKDLTEIHGLMQSLLMK